MAQNYFEVPEIYQPSFIGGDNVVTPTIDMSSDASGLGDLFKGVDLKGFGTLAGVIGGIYGASEDRKYKKDLLKREDARVEQENARYDRFHNGLRKAYGIDA